MNSSLSLELLLKKATVKSTSKLYLKFFQCDSLIGSGIKIARGIYINAVACIRQDESSQKVALGTEYIDITAWIFRITAAENKDVSGTVQSDVLVDEFGWEDE